MRRKILGMVLAGGRGKRLMPLTLHRSKPGVPFGGIYRIVDFVLSNFVNSGIRSIYVLTQFKSQSLTEHIHRSWSGQNRAGHFIIPVPAQMQTPGEIWYTGTADAIFQNLNLVHDTHPDLVCVFGGDHIYFMNLLPMLREHLHNEADVTIAALPVACEEASRFGVLECGEGGRVTAFHEKVAEPPTIPGDPDRCYASMGNYVFGREALVAALLRDAEDPDSTHDFGGDVLPRMVAEGRNVRAYDFESNEIPGREGPNVYWRDVGTLDAYYEANLDLKEVVPRLDLYNNQWPMHAHASSAPPAKFVHDQEGRTGEAIYSIVGPGTIVSGAIVRHSVLGRNVRVHSYCQVDGSVILDGVSLARGCKVRRAVIDKDVQLPGNTEVGYDAESDRARGWHVTESGITVVPKEPAIRPVCTLDI